MSFCLRPVYRFYENRIFIHDYSKTETPRQEVGIIRSNRVAEVSLNTAIWKSMSAPALENR